MQVQLTIAFLFAWVGLFAQHPMMTAHVDSLEQTFTFQDQIATAGGTFIGEWRADVNVWDSLYTASGAIADSAFVYDWESLDGTKILRQATYSKRPRYIDDGGPNSLPCLESWGTDVLDLVSGFGGSDYHVTVFMVIKTVGSNPTNADFLHSSGTNGVRAYFNTNSQLKVYGGATMGPGTCGSPNSWKVWCLALDSEDSDLAETSYFYQGSSTACVSGKASNNYSSRSWGDIKIGDDGGTATPYFRISHLVFIKGALWDSATIGKGITYLKNEWGL